ncbi:MAG: energy transducer TonB [Candidatus Azotimanducaceae bacterium WSBS_2022_MAG_OTU7]
MVDLHPSIKFFSVCFSAFVATCLCFYLMLFLITNEISSEIEFTTPSYVRPSVMQQKATEPVATRTKPQKALPLQPPPAPGASQLNRTVRVEFTAERPTFGSIAEIIGQTDLQLELEAPHSELTPLSIVRPIYPLSAAMKEIEGFVIVKFTVRENGTVSNPIVVDSEPAILFDDAALHAVVRFKFKPREVGGDRVSVENVQLKFAFTLESLYDLKDNRTP